MHDYFPLSLCTTGMVPRTQNNRHVPVKSIQIVEQVLEIYHATGLTSVHIHARRPNEDPAWEREYFSEIISGIRNSAPEIVLCVTTSGRDVIEFEKRSDVLNLEGELKPDLASLTLSSMNFLKTASLNSPQMVKDLLYKMLENRILPEFEVFDVGMLNVLTSLISEFDLTHNPIVNLIMGNYSGFQAEPLDLGFAISRLPNGTIWSVGGIGKAQTKAVVMGLVSGGGVRIGLEDNLFFDAQKTPATNLMLVQRVARIAQEFDKRIMPPSVLRRLAGLC